MVRLIFLGVIFAAVYGWFNFSDRPASDLSDVSDVTKVEEVIKASVNLSPEVQSEPEIKLTSTYKVVKVVDGDTIVIDRDGLEETIRMIGVDTPETVHPSKAVQCFGAEASLRTKEWLSGSEVALEFDPSQGERDKYGRLLAYVFRSDGLFVNKELIAQGFAYEYTYNLPYKYQSDFKAAEDAARGGGTGLWSSAACTDSDRATHTDNQSTNPVYSADHIDKDCSDFSTQAEAQTYFEAGRGSATYNYDRLDSDHDGVACESLP